MWRQSGAVFRRDLCGDSAQADGQPVCALAYSNCPTIWATGVGPNPASPIRTVRLSSLGSASAGRKGNPPAPTVGAGGLLFLQVRRLRARPVRGGSEGALGPRGGPQGVPARNVAEYRETAWNKLRRRSEHPQRSSARSARIPLHVRRVQGAAVRRSPAAPAHGRRGPARPEDRLGLLHLRLTCNNRQPGEEARGTLKAAALIMGDGLQRSSTSRGGSEGVPTGTHTTPEEPASSGATIRSSGAPPPGRSSGSSHRSTAVRPRSPRSGMKCA